MLTPILIYETESWSCTAREEKKTLVCVDESVENDGWKIRRNRVRNQGLKEKVGVGSVLNKVDSARVR